MRTSSNRSTRCDEEPYDDTEFSGRSDYQAFIEAGIPAGGLFTGAEVPKTAEQAAIWGGTVGAQFDPCYHLACDTFGNVNLHALDVNADADCLRRVDLRLLHGIGQRRSRSAHASSTPLPAPAGPEGTCPVTGGCGAGGLGHGGGES